MTATFLTHPQRSPEWFAARLGRVTGSCAADMLATNKTKGEAAVRKNLRVRLVLEQLTGVAQEDGYTTREMQRGIELEPVARAVYETECDALVQSVGFLRHDTLMAGCSLDGLVYGGGIVEIKAPNSATHLDYLRGEVPLKYLRQCQHNLWLTGAPWCDFVSYDPRFPPALQLKITRLTMTEQERKAYELTLRLFLGEVEQELEAVRQLMTPISEDPAA
jgi:predicted phage-related endonuclease